MLNSSHNYQLTTHNVGFHCAMYSTMTYFNMHKHSTFLSSRPGFGHGFGHLAGTAMEHGNVPNQYLPSYTICLAPTT